MTKSRIIAGMATIARREAAMMDAVASIAPQVDQLYVYLNDYAKARKLILYGLLDERFPKLSERVYFHEADVGDLGDSGKFYGKRYEHDIYFSVDDDLIYPPDYVETTLKHLEEFPVVTYHGREMLRQPVRTYYHGIKRPYHVNSNVDQFARVHVGGTGVMAHRANDFSVADCLHPNMADIWFGLYCQKHRIPIRVAPHRKGWIKLTDKINHHKDTIWSKHERNDKVQTEVFNSIKWQLY